MKNIVLIMDRKAIVESLMLQLEDNSYINLIYEADYNNANIIIDHYKAKVALIEVTESGLYDMDYCLALCKRLRKESPECKLLLMCPEQDGESVKQVIQAKGKKQIDDFVFYDVTIDYLASKLISM